MSTKGSCFASIAILKSLGKIYCETYVLGCILGLRWVMHSRHERPQTYPDTTIIKGNSGASSKCCPRCKGTVFEAEKVVEKGLTYHRKCFTCVKCKRPQDDKLQVRIIHNFFENLHNWDIIKSRKVFVGFDNEVYCKVCYPKIWHTPLPMDPQSTSKIRAGPQDNDCCPRCFGKVFEAEKMMVGHGVYHIPCFSCKICTRPIDHYNCVSHQVSDNWFF